MKFIPTIPGRAAMLFLIGSAAQASPVLDDPRAYNPISRSSDQITGPVIISRSAIVFGNGARSDLDLLARETSDWTGSGDTHEGQVFSLKDDPGELMNGNALCGNGEVPRFLVAHQAERFEFRSLVLSVFAGEARPDSIASPGICGTYYFAMRNAPGGGGTEPAPDEMVSVPENQDTAGTDSVRTGKWRVTRSTSPLDDTPVFAMILTADEGQSRLGDTVTFIARCKSNETEAYINWNTYVGDDSSSPYSEYKYVQVRIGDGQVKPQMWGVSTDKRATFAPDWAGDMLKRMVDEDQMVARITPYGESPVTAIFDTRGMRAPLEELSDTCNWSF